MPGIEAFFKSNMTYIIGIIFACGVIYTQVSHLNTTVAELKVTHEKEVKTLSERLDKKIKIISDTQDRVDILDKDLAVEKALNAQYHALEKSIFIKKSE